MVNNVITIDYDGTIGDQFNGDFNSQKKLIHDWIMRLIRRGYDVHIVTRRYGPEFANKGKGNEHVEVLDMAFNLGIDADKVIFTNREWKYKTLKKLNSIIHLDDDENEKKLIELHLPNTKSIWIESTNWEDELIREIDTHDHIKIWLSSPENILRLGFAIGGLLLIFLLF